MTSPEFPRQYVAGDADFGQWSTAEPYLQELAERDLPTEAAVERWLIDVSELESGFDEAGTQRYIAMTRDTRDAERQQAYLHFVEHVAPHAEPYRDRIRRRFAEAAARLDLPPRRYEVLERNVRNAIALYREENIPLLVEDSKLRTEYQALTGAMSCTWEGEELTIQQMSRFLEEPDRDVRERAWRMISDRYQRDAPQLDELYVKMVGLRDQVARNAGCRDYREYAFRAMERFDYSPADCLEFHDTIEKVVVPAVGELARRRREKLGLARLRPWDTAVDPEGRPPLRPFQTAEELAEGCSRIFHQVSPELGRTFDTLRERGLLDLDSRAGKAPGGYQAVYAERRLPFIFMNAAGLEGDVRTLLHEGGHAFHTWACRQEPLVAYRSAPIEFAEVASMGMECLSLPHTHTFFGQNTPRATQRFFEKIVGFFPFMACIDAFQHHVYTHVDAGVESWKDYWQSLTRRFAPELDFDGLESYDRQSWQKKLHIYEVPLYYVEYGIAQLGALQVWKQARTDYEHAVALYRNGLALGGARPLPELFEAAGCRFDFREATVRPLIDEVLAEVDRLACGTASDGQG